MANTCSVCRHESRESIERALARGESLRRIGSQFGVGYKAVEGHQRCVAEALFKARDERLRKTLRDVREELERCFQANSKLLAACDLWLQDPDDPQRYTLEPRAGEVQVIYEEQEGERWERRRAPLSQLLREVTSETRRVVNVESRTADPRQLILDAISGMSGLVDRLARLTGEYQLDRENDRERLERREILVEALLMIHEQDGRVKTRDEVVKEIEDSMLKVNAVWNEARLAAQRRGAIM